MLLWLLLSTLYIYVYTLHYISSSPIFSCPSKLEYSVPCCRHCLLTGIFLQTQNVIFLHKPLNAHCPLQRRMFGGALTFLLLHVHMYSTDMGLQWRKLINCLNTFGIICSINSFVCSLIAYAKTQAPKSFYRTLQFECLPPSAESHHCYFSRDINPLKINSKTKNLKHPKTHWQEDECHTWLWTCRNFKPILRPVVSHIERDTGRIPSSAFLNDSWEWCSEITYTAAKAAECI